MMRWKFAFGLASDDLFYVTTRPDDPSCSEIPIQSKMTTFLDEDEFLWHLIRAGLPEDQTAAIAVAVLVSIAKPVSPPDWLVLDLSQRQMELLHLSNAMGGHATPPVAEGKDVSLQAARTGALPQFYDILMQVPTAVAMLVGRDHRYTFVNLKYVELMGAKPASELLGKPIVEVFPDFRGSRTIEVLNRVYETGEPYVGTENLRSFYRENSGRVEGGYFNTVFQPIRNAFGEVSGVMVQSTDVTEIVLARDVRENRESLLYRQWAELDAIYRNAPVAMMLIDAKDFRILRLNEKQAELLGYGVGELLGRPLLEVARDPADLRRVLTQVLRGEPIREHIVEGELLHSAALPRYWLKTYSPTLSAAGKVESIILVAMEISEETKVAIEAVTLKELETMV